MDLFTACGGIEWRAMVVGAPARPSVWALLAACVALAAAEAWRSRRRARKLRREVVRLEQLRLAERSGRTAAERQLRRLAAAAQCEPAAEQPALRQCRFRPIGTIESCYMERRGTPRQGLLAPAARSRLRLNRQVVQPEALEGLEGFSHVWLIFEFHENTNSSKVAAAFTSDSGAGAQDHDAALSKRARGRIRQKQVKGAADHATCMEGLTKTCEERAAPSAECAQDTRCCGPPVRISRVRAKVHPPGMLGSAIGLFATRTPHRPNPIGLSAARLLAIEGDVLLLGGADLIDGTPVLDIKP